MRVVILLPTGVTVFEALGPYGVFRRAEDAQITMLGDRAGRVPGHGSKVALVADASYLFVEPHGVADVLVVPGGLGIQGLLADRSVLDWLRAAQATATWTVAVSTGSVLLSAAGVLDGREATTHWLATDLLAESGARPVAERIVRSGSVLTATGAVAGLEAALFVVARLEGQARADDIRGQLDDEVTGELSKNRPVAPAVLAELSAAGTRPDEPAPFDLGPDRPARRRRPTRRRRRWTPRAGRLIVSDGSPRRMVSPRR